MKASERFEEHVKQSFYNAMFVGMLGIIMLVAVVAGLIVLITKIGLYKILSYDPVSIILMFLAPIMLFGFSALSFIRYRRYKKIQKDLKAEEDKQQLVASAKSN
ncbi:MAG: hypothetical protein HY005_00740 [Candidatus Staskawiczbacteria bacterium]|nr:hypothetical protein [Candidatus Staskawiczbacteria bacterium]MBI3337135.1 hypothetical protein [Candidatus Staskawiczbacteria bacterium]